MDDRYFDHDADIGIIGRGNSLENCFANTAESLFSLMTDLTQVHTTTQIHFQFVEDDIELALVTWLNLLLAKAQIENLILAKFQIQKTNQDWQCSAAGEPWPANLERGIDVKGATLTMLSVKKIDELWEARCVVDV